MTKFIIGLCLLAGISYGQYASGGGGGSGNVSAVGVLTNDQVVVGAGGGSVKTTGVEAYDPNILIDMIGTNSTAIDDRYGDSVVVVESTSDALVNGTNLITAVQSFTSVSNDGTVMVTEGTYTIPEDLVITNCMINLRAIVSSPLYGVFDNSAILDDPIVFPPTIINGDVVIASDPATLRSVVSGFKIMGSVSAPRSAVTDNATPPVLENSYVRDDVALNETTALVLSGSFVFGSFAEGGLYDCGSVNSIVIGDNSFGGMADQGGVYLHENLWLGGSGGFASSAGKTRAGTTFNGGIVSGLNLFNLDTDENAFAAYGTLFFNTQFSTNLWAGLKDTATTKIYNSFNVYTNLTGFSTGTIRGSYDWLGNSADN